jgi:hypothetical protein
MGLSSPDTGSVTVKQVKFIQTHQQRPTHPLPSRAKNDKTSSPTATATAVPKLMIRLPTTSTRSRFSPTTQLPIPTINIIDSPVSERGSDPYKSQQGRDSGGSEVELVADIHPGPLAVDKGRKRRGVSTTTGESDDEDDTDAPPAQKRKVVLVPMNELRCDECIHAKLQECDHHCTVCQQREIRCVPPPFSSRFTICMPCRTNGKKACTLQPYFKEQKLRRKALDAQAASKKAVKRSSKGPQKNNPRQQQPSRPLKGQANYANPNSDDDAQDKIELAAEVKKDAVGKRIKEEQVDVGDSLLQPKTKKARINPTTSATPLPIIYDPQTMEKVGPRQDPLPSSVVAESSSFKPASAETFIPPPSNTGQPSALLTKPRISQVPPPSVVEETSSFKPASEEEFVPRPSNAGQPSALLTKPRISQVPPPSVVEETSSIKPASVEQFVPPPSNAGQPSALLTEPRISQVPPPFVVETSSFKSVSVEKFVPPSSDSGHPPALLTKLRISQVLPPSDVETSSFKSVAAKQFVPPPGNVGRPSALLTKPRTAQQAPAHPITQTPLASPMSPEYDFPRSLLSPTDSCRNPGNSRNSGGINFGTGTCQIDNTIPAEF